MALAGNSAYASIKSTDTGISVELGGTIGGVGPFGSTNTSVNAYGQTQYGSTVGAQASFSAGVANLNAKVGLTSQNVQLNSQTVQHTAGIQLTGTATLGAYRATFDFSYSAAAKNVSLPTIEETVADTLSGFRDPIVLDLMGSGIAYKDFSQSNAYFDLSDAGIESHSAWISNQDAFLVKLPDPTRVATSGAQLSFGGGLTDFGYLTANDVNHDGLINSLDPIYNNLGVWQDKNGDGVCSPDEIQSLAARGIVSINAGAYETGYTQPISGSDHFETAWGGYTRSDGSAGAATEVSLGYSNTEASRLTNSADGSQQTITAPNGSGTLVVDGPAAAGNLTIEGGETGSQIIVGPGGVVCVKFCKIALERRSRW